MTAGSQKRKAVLTGLLLVFLIAVLSEGVARVFAPFSLVNGEPYFEISVGHQRGEFELREVRGVATRERTRA